MSLIKTWAPFFQSSVRMRGRGYFMGGRVEQVPPQGDELVRANVRGSQAYTVMIYGEGSSASAHCSCAFFNSGSYCKHIWATLLDIQHNGQLSARQSASGHNGESAPPADAVQVIDSAPPPPPKARKRDPSRKPVSTAEPEWVGRLSLLRPTMNLPDQPAPGPVATHRQVCYVVCPHLSNRFGGLVVELRQRQPAAGGWSRPKRMRIRPASLHEFTDPADRELCALLLGAAWVDHEDADYDDPQRSGALFKIPVGAQRTLVQRMVQTGRCFIDMTEDTPDSSPAPLRWDGGEPWTLWVVGSDNGEGLSVEVELRRGQQVMSINDPTLIVGGADGMVFTDETAAALDDRDAFRWVQQFRDDMRLHGQAKPIAVPTEDVPRFLDRLYTLPQLPEIDLPEGVGRVEKRVPPQPVLEVFSPGAEMIAVGASRQTLVARVSFEYEQNRIKPGQPGRFVTAVTATVVEQPEPREQEPTDDTGHGDEDESPPEAPATEATDEAAPPRGELIRRNLRLENEYLTSLFTVGLRPNTGAGGDTLLLSTKQMAGVVSTLLSRGWRVTADHKLIRHPGAPSMTVVSGVDWFELRGGVKFQTATGERTVSLPEILLAARAGRNMIDLGDGTQGVLPEEWLAQHGLLTGLAELHDDHLRFKSSQASLLDALLSRQELVNVDDRFEQARQRLRHFEKIEPVPAAPTFEGTLRPYQKDGLGWLAFLRWFGVGGILADDMGLGKTIQVLAALDAIYDNDPPTDNANATPDSPTVAGNGSSNQKSEISNQKPLHRPTLIVVPRSVVFNWIDEAQRFAPRLRVQAYTGADRASLRDAFIDHDVIVTSYGLMRRDIEELCKHPFEYVVLDEAQAIKNPSSQSARAARLIDARHRLALTGTPVENHLGDLWSIFEFLNPGMLGSGTRFAELVKGNGELKNIDVATQASRALRPFILRRTKKQVLKDLPEKTEQTILCTMENGQRALYDQLLTHYRSTLLKSGDAAAGSGDNGAGAVSGGGAMMVLEALLRLRQAACHPGLIDPRRAEEPSAKMDVLLDRLSDLVEEGHKALVFSQFTSLLALVRTRLEQRGIVYEYLDGQTRQRRKRVQRFQGDPSCPVFLISLKAGGLGLNLTAAEYVFILDPWWNPAVEAQAIDRAHRIGQTRHVFAYRLICEDTVEQRIAELQQKKKTLADAIVGGQENLLRSLTREDLERLLS